MDSKRQKGQFNEKIQQYQETDNEELATFLLLEYEPMVKMAAKKMSRNRPDFYEDLFQVGQMSLLRSLQQFDTSKGFIFEAYAMKSLIGHMKNYLRDKSWYIQVPRKIKEKGARIQQTIDELTMKLERSPDIHEIAESLELTVEQTIEVLVGREYYQYVSIDTPLKSEEDSATIGDIIGSEDDDFQDLENRLDLHEAINQLAEQDKHVLHLAFVENESQRTIAKRLGISQVTVSRIQKRAVSELRQILSDSSLTGSK
ncbi:RNA polymerase subunit sigma-70 [Ammoniphilus oxalaticus]|uniref:RNA polymerase subunit sigma-70 n=1 Tax=Ammoniphilus oxalaticus TaxID=66863 RepID=A0A419SFR8_9BACL|nr:sigma-70 family RNA polymerase sigma factor [Ammoniphilus oxalaticus]RKD22632.1 RNA polymerase subunit sigma-70 [Ammoniphilus oxalaticus]